MKRLALLNSTPVLAEFGPTSLKMLDGTDGLELSLERADNGRLTALCLERLVQSLRVFFRNRAWTGRRPVLCAIGARGLSLRTLTLPRAPRDEMDRVVLLQIEREFPLLPEELAWGYLLVGSNGTGGATEALVAAIKRDLIGQYEEVLTACGLTPTFTVAACARRHLCPESARDFSILDLGRSTSELISFRNGLPLAIRSVAFGGDTVTEAIRTRLGTGRAEAEKLKLELHDPSAPVADAAAREAAREVIASEVAGFAGSIPKDWISGNLYLTGGSARLEGLAEAMARSVGAGLSCERIPIPSGDGQSAAIAGLKRLHDDTGRMPSLILRMPVGMSSPAAGSARSASWKWAALAAFLALVCLALRYLEPVLGQASIQRHILELRQRQARLPQVDRELGFLQHVRTNQPPYLDLVHTFATSAPPGTKMTSIALSRRGDIALRASMGGAEQVTGFRSKLIESGLFAGVVVDEQTPNQDRQVTVRITGQRAEGLVKAAKAPAPAVPKPAAPNPTAPPGADAGVAVLAGGASTGASPSAPSTSTTNLNPAPGPVPR